MTYLLSKHKIEVNGLPMGFDVDGFHEPFWGITTFEGLGEVGAVFESGQRAQDDGLWRTFGFAGGRSLRVAGFCHHPNTTDMYTLHRTLNQAIERTREVPVTYHYPSGISRTCHAARDGEVAISTGTAQWFEFSFTMLATDPNWYYQEPWTGQTGLRNP